MNIIEGAKILLYAEGNFGFVELVGSCKTQEIQKLVIAQYDRENSVYLFACSKNFDVLGDTVHESVQSTQQFAVDYYGGKNLLWIKVT